MVEKNKMMPIKGHLQIPHPNKLIKLKNPTHDTWDEK